MHFYKNVAIKNKTPDYHDRKEVYYGSFLQEVRFIEGKFDLPYLHVWEKRG